MSKQLNKTNKKCALNMLNCLVVKSIYSFSDNPTISLLCFYLFLFTPSSDD